MRLWVSTPRITVKVVVANGLVEETFTAWPDLRGLPLDRFVTVMKDRYGEELLMEELR